MSSNHGVPTPPERGQFAKKIASRYLARQLPTKDPIFLLIDLAISTFKVKNCVLACMIYKFC